MQPKEPFHCPGCGKPLAVREDAISKLYADRSIFLGTCENGHRWRIIENLSDHGRVEITQLLESNDEDCDENGCDEEDEVGGQELDLARQYN